MTATLNFPLALHVEGEPALAEAMATTAIAAPGAWAYAALLICRRETAALVRQSLIGYNVSLQLAAPHPQGAPVRICWTAELLAHPHVAACPLKGSWVHLLVAPQCSLSSWLRSFGCPRRIVMGRSREQLLKNIYRCLMALSPFPLHPSWEAPVMRRLLALAEEGKSSPLLLFPSGDALQFALVDIEEAAREVEQLWKDRVLPVPDNA